MPGSALVVRALQEGDLAEYIELYYEGNVDGAVNCFTLYGRCQVACSRCYLDYPTQAKLRLPRREAQRAFRIAARYHPALRQIEILDEAAFREWDDTWYPPQPMISTAVH